MPPRPPDDGGSEEAEAAHLCRLAVCDPDLAYLALLTARTIKPAGLWTRPLRADLVADLCGLGLTVRDVRRVGALSLPVSETVFSTDPARLEAYALRFAGHPLDRTPDVRRLEGELLGYPACCIRRFLEQPFVPNGLSPRDQALLFHWACPDCAETRRLLPLYRKVRDEVWARCDVRSLGAE